MKETVLVTGGASFIGSHLVDSLLKNEFIVKVADDFSSGIYLYTIKAGRFIETKQMMYLK